MFIRHQWNEIIKHSRKILYVFMHILVIVIVKTYSDYCSFCFTDVFECCSYLLGQLPAFVRWPFIFCMPILSSKLHIGCMDGFFCVAFCAKKMLI